MPITFLFDHLVRSNQYVRWYRQADLKCTDLTRGGVSDTFSVLLDDSIRPVKHGRRNRQADLLRRLQVDD
jgi:hypothetical protein